MEGVALLLSTICMNTKYCPSPHLSPQVNFNEIFPRTSHQTAKAISTEMERLAADIKGRNISVTTLEDYPLSYVERANETQLANGSGIFIGKGWAFEFFNHLAQKYNFTYHILLPDINIIGSSNNSQGSLMQMVNQRVRFLMKLSLLTTF